MRYLLLAVLTLALTIACSESPTEPSGGDVVMTLNSDTFESTDTIVLTISNGLDHPIRVSICPGAEPQKQTNHGEWESVWPLPEICPDFLPPPLASGESMTLYFNPDWGDGTFRFIQGIYDNQSTINGRTIHSKQFSVT